VTSTEHMLRATPRCFARGLAFGRRPHVRPPPPPPPPSFVTQSGVPELSLFSVVGANMVVHAFWQDRRWQPFMHRHFVLSLESVRRRRWHTMITSAFSQLSPSHLLTNMVMLSFFGLSLPRRLGVPAFATLYLAGSVVSSSAWLAEQQTLRDRTSALRERAEIQAAGCVGASGAVAACVTGACVLDPGRRVYLFFLVPIPAIGFAGLYVLSDFWGLLAAAHDPGGSAVAHSGHLGGALAGAAFVGLMRVAGRVR